MKRGKNARRARQSRDPRPRRRHVVLAPMAPLAPSGNWALVALAPYFLVAMGWGCLRERAWCRLIAPANLRGRIAALYLACGSLTGIIMATVGVGAITDYIMRDPLQSELFPGHRIVPILGPGRARLRFVPPGPCCGPESAACFRFSPSDALVAQVRMQA